MSDPKMVTITAEEHKRLTDDSELLNALRAAGVDNWDGWSDAVESLNENQQEETC